MAFNQLVPFAGQNNQDQNQNQNQNQQEQPAELALRLDTAPSLLLNLGLCIAVASSREASRVRLPASAPGGTGLSTNLVQIANEGSNAFLGAYKDLLDISNASDELCRENGRLDQLAYVIVHGAAKSSRNKVFQWVLDCIATCESCGAHTARNFDSWKITVQEVEKAVGQAKDQNGVDLDMIGMQKRVATSSLDVNQVQMSGAMREVAFAINQHNARSNIYTRRSDAHELLVSEQLKEYMFNPFVQAIKRPLKWAAGSRPVDDAEELRIEAQRDLNEAFRELTQRRKEEMELKLRASRLSAEIEDYKYKEMKLTDIGHSLSEVFILLEALSKDVLNLLTTFATISSEIERIVSKRKALEEKGGINLGFVKINPFRQKSTMTRFNKKDKALENMIFLEDIRHMKQICLGIQINAKLYATIINEVVNYGFSEAIRVSYDSLGKDTPSEAVAARKEMMKRWRDEAGKICSAKNIEAMKALQAGLLSMDRAAHMLPGSVPMAQPFANAGQAPDGMPFQQQTYPQQAFAYPPQGFAPQGYPPQGFQPQGFPQQGFPQGVPPRGFR